MNRVVEKMLIVVKPGDAEASAVRSSMAAFLKGKGVAFDTCEHRPEACGEADDVVGPYDLIVVLGGDGTFIGAARRLLRLEAPFMGVNLGRVGFLAQLERDCWRPWLEQVLTDGVEVARRLVLTYEVLREGRAVHSGLFINDLVISRGELARLIRLRMSFDGVPVSSLRADGLIVSTPTGSSAYGASAGGPLVHVGLAAYCVTPVCPFLSSFKPMVFPAEGRVAVCVEERQAEVNLTEDGQSATRLHFGDEVVLRKSGLDLLVAALGPEAYFEKLKKHGFLTER